MEELMYSGRTRNYRWQTRASRGNKGLWWLIIASLALAGLLALTIIARNQETSLTTHVPSAAAAKSEADQGTVDKGTVLNVVERAPFFKDVIR